MSGQAFLVDTTKCTGCHACQVSCKQWNNLPAEKTEFFGGPELTNPAELSAITFNHVIFFPVDRSNPERPLWTIMHKKCYHCKDANCEKACPQKAIYKLDGWTVIDHSRCIGCGACRNECIYRVPHVLGENLKTYGTEQPLVRDKAYKCHACTVNKRKVPSCASHCPTGALTFGERSSLVQKAQLRLDQVKKDFPRANIYGLHEFGGLNVLTILKDNPEKYNLPVNPKPYNAAKADSIRDVYELVSAFTMGMPSLKRMAYKISKSIVG